MLYMVGVAGALCHLPNMIRIAFSRYQHGEVLWSYFIVIFFLTFLLLLLLPAFQQTYLYFNRKRFEIGWKMFNLCYWRRQGKTTEINGWSDVYADPEGRKRDYD